LVARNAAKGRKSSSVGDCSHFGIGHPAFNRDFDRNRGGTYFFGVCGLMAYFEQPHRGAKIAGEVLGWVIVAAFGLTVIIAAYH